MKKIVFIILFYFVVSITYAQKTVAVLSGTNWTFYDDFSPALRGAPTGSVIYLPGGTFDLGSYGDTINKSLTIIGVGFSLDSASATGITRLLGYLYLDNGADYTTIEGVSIDGVASLNNSSSYSNIYIRRCYLTNLDFHVWTNNYGKNYYVSESVICSLNGGSVPNNSFIAYNNLKIEKCIITNTFWGCYGSIFNNNILHAQDNGYVYNNACEFNNNIFVDSARNYEVATNSFFNNNIFRVGNFGTGGTNVYTSCVWNKLLNTIFVNPQVFSEGGCDAVYNSQYNFHLKATSPAKNFGTDGTDAGIYGTTTPCKDGWVPSNPHIAAKTIGPSSLSNGTLPVNIKTIAQDR